MKKILIIGDGNSIFVKDFIRQMSNNNILVDLLALTGNEEIEGVRKQINTCKEKDKGNPWKNQIYLFSSIKNALSKFDEKYDSVIIHFIYYFISLHIPSIKRKTKNIVSVVWGSDFYRTKGLKALSQNAIYLASNRIVFTNPETKNIFYKKKKFISENNLKIARFGLPALDEINKFRLKNLTRENACKKFGFPEEKVIISVGYNANVTHMQTLVIEKFALLPESIRKKGFLVFPLGYGELSTRQIILNKLNQNNIHDYAILDTFLGFKDVAELRCGTDVLINIQPSDQFSGSMQEILYSGGRVIAGAWLPYQEIIENKATIRSIATIDEVGEALSLEISAGKKQHLFPQKSVIDFIDRSSSWKENMKIWNNILFG